MGEGAEVTEPNGNEYIRKYRPLISWGVKAADVLGWQPCHLRVLLSRNSASLNLLEP
jgi:hypothetical protein